MMQQLANFCLGTDQHHAYCSNAEASHSDMQLQRCCGGAVERLSDFGRF